MKKLYHIPYDIISLDMTLDSSRLDSRTGGHDRLDRRGGMWWNVVDFVSD